MVRSTLHVITLVLLKKCCYFCKWFQHYYGFEWAYQKDLVC
jgi:hypothetical protein